MSGEDFEGDELLARVGEDRKAFLKRLLIGAAFASPIVASFPIREALGAAQTHFHSPAYGSYSPSGALTHYGHRGYGNNVYAAYPFDLDSGA
jgi:hypothetical protein